MLHSSLIKPKSIAVIGGSNSLSKPGGKMVTNLISGTFSGDLFVVNPKNFFNDLYISNSVNLLKLDYNFFLLLK